MIRQDLIFFGTNQACFTTGCWRGYQAEWTILDKQLYLTGIYSCCYYEDGIKADLKMLFGSKFKNGKVKADWVTNNVIAPFGKLLYYVHQGYDSIYEREFELQFNKGKLIYSLEHDNSKSKQSIYSQNQAKLNEFIYKNIEWNNLPEIDNKIIKVFVEFSTNIDGDIDSVTIARGYDEIFNNEAMRVIKIIPEWDVIFKHEKLNRRRWIIPVIFSNENKRKYDN